VHPQEDNCMNTTSGIITLLVAVQMATNTELLYQMLYSYSCLTEDEHRVAQNM
jgi:hypothetical protein